MKTSNEQTIEKQQNEIDDLTSENTEIKAKFSYMEIQLRNAKLMKGNSSETVETSTIETLNKSIIEEQNKNRQLKFEMDKIRDESQEKIKGMNIQNEKEKSLLEMEIKNTKREKNDLMNEKEEWTNQNCNIE